MAIDIFHCPKCGEMLSEHDIFPYTKCWKCGLEMTEEETTMLCNLVSEETDLDLKEN